MEKLNGREAAILARNLSPGEAVLGQFVGRYGQALVVTDRKVLIVKAGLMAGQTFGGKASSFGYRTITSVEVRTGVVGGVFEVASGGVQGAERSAWGTGAADAAKAPNCVPLLRSHFEAFQRAAALIRERIAAQDAPAPGAPPQLSPDGRWWWDGQRWLPAPPP